VAADSGRIGDAEIFDGGGGLQLRVGGEHIGEGAQLCPVVETSSFGASAV
jgi:hypothetical protein